MPNSINATNITPPRVALIDERTGLISREWYRFFLNLFTLTGGGTNQTTLVDLQLGPPPVVGEDLSGIIIDIESLQSAPTQESALDQIAELAKQINALASTPPNDVQELVDQIWKSLQALEIVPRPELGTMSQLQQAWVPWMTFDNAPEVTPPTVGTVAWDGGTTLGVQMTTNVLGRVNESGYYYIKASSAITKGDVVMFTGAVGASGVPTGAPATGVTDGSYIMGIAAESLALNAFGLVQFIGTLRGLNTSAFSDGDILWYDPAVTGGLTKTKPSAPNVKVQMAAVINAGSGSSGSILIRVNSGSVLGGTDSNVQFGTLANNDLIQYDSALQYWKNVAPSSISIGTATNLAGGAAGSVPYQTAPGTTSFVGIGTALQVFKVNAGATAPEWVSGAALTKTDDTNVTLTLGGTPATSLLAATSLTLGWTGQLAISRGGTGVNTTPANGQLLIGNGTGYTVANLTAGSGVTISNSAGGITIAATGTGGTVTSVGLSMPTQFTVTNSPVTSSGTLTASWNNQTANYVFAGPTTGAAAAPTFRALVSGDIPALSYVSSVGATAPITSTGGLTPTIGVTSAALTKSDDTNVTLTLGGSPTTALLAATSLTLGWSGQLAVSRGGTGVATTTANYVFAGPTSGGAAAPSFRALVASDIPALSYVTSVSGTSPVVSSGGTTPAISLASGYGDTQNPYASKTANYVLAAPNGSAGVPTFRALVAADIPTLPYQPTAAPVTYTANFSVATTDVWIINNKSGSSCTATLPTASSYSGRVLRFQNYQAQTLVSATSNVVQITGGAATTSILLASAGDQCTLVSDGTNWIMTQYIPNNILLLE